MAGDGRPAGQGWFITIEGPEGAGKTTQAARLEADLAAGGLTVIRTREPGGTRLGELLRDLLLARGGAPIDPTADALLFNAARRQLVTEVIEPALAAGTTVVCTRWADSTLAYQGYGSGVPLAELLELQSIATGGLEPDLTILLDLPVELGLGRKRGDDLTRFETSFDTAFHDRVRQGFLELAADNPQRFAVVDAAVGEDAVFAAVRASVDARLRVADPHRPDEPERAGTRIIR